jgi:hypothetical protein
VSLVYQPPTNPRFIRFVYIVAADGDGSFGGPDGQPLAAAGRPGSHARGCPLMQTFTAETMKRAGWAGAPSGWPATPPTNPSSRCSRQG